MSLRCDSTIAATSMPGSLNLLRQLAEVAERGQRPPWRRAARAAVPARSWPSPCGPWRLSSSAAFELSSPWSSPPGGWDESAPQRGALRACRLPALVDVERLADAGAERAGLRAARWLASAHARGSSASAALGAARLRAAPCRRVETTGRRATRGAAACRRRCRTPPRSAPPATRRGSRRACASSGTVRRQAVRPKSSAPQ